MLAIALQLFLAGLLTILLPCILPLVPIVLGVSAAGRSKFRPLLIIAGMMVSFVGFTFILLVVLNQFVEFADYVRIGTFYVLLLFGLGFITHDRIMQIMGAVGGALFFFGKGIVPTIVAAIVGIIAMEIGGRIATRIQQVGTDVQHQAMEGWGAESPLTAFIIGLTLGLVWVPCAGPALGFALTLVREQPGFQSLLLLTAYAAGSGLPLLLVGYGGQRAVHSVRAITPYTGVIKQIAGVFLILIAIGLRLDLVQALQTGLGYGDFATKIEESLFNPSPSPSGSVHPNSMNLPKLPKITRAPEFTGLGTWHNLPASGQGQPLTMQSLRGKVVLVDFWTYSCINCIRTLPYIQGYWDKFKDTGKFVIVGVHTPEFVFEKSDANVANAIKEHGLTYPVAQDNDFGTWGAFANRYWPAKYLIDADGYIRYTHFGEGNYDETDRAIQSLLQEIGVNVSGKTNVQVSGGGNRDVSPETYLGSRSWPALGNQQGAPSDQAVSYKDPVSMQLNKYYLAGDWQLTNDEYQLLQSKEGEIRMKFLGAEINLVLGLQDGASPVSGDVFIDGKQVKTITVDRHDLFNLFKGDYGEHEMALRLRGKGVEGYAFTFGGN